MVTSMGTISLLNTKRSLTRDFSIRFILIIILLSIIVFSTSSITLIKIQNSKFRQDSSIIFNDFKKFIVPPLWHYDDEEITSICKTFISGGIVSQIKIYSNDDRLLYEFGGLGAENSPSEFYSDDLIFNTKNIGRVELYTKKDNYTKNNAYYFSTTITGIVLISLFISIATWKLLHIYVGRPLENLLAWINQIKNGNYKDLNISFPQKEIQDVMNHFSIMVDSVKKRELELRESENFLKTIIENIPDMIFVKDAKELRFVRFNKAGEELLGYSREELIGKNDYDFFPTEEADFFTKKDREVLSEKEHLDIPEEPIQTKNKGERILHTKKLCILDENDNPQYLLGISEDITERKMAETALRESERKLHAIFDHHYQLTGLIDTEGRLLASNRTALNLAGAEESEVIGRYFWDGPWWKPSQRPALKNAVERAARGEFIRFETNHPAADGEIRYIDFSLSPVRDDDGNVIYIVPEGRDITEIRRAEAGKAALQEQLNQAQKMEAIGTLAGGIAHDFNNILSAIIGFTEISLRDAPQGSKLKENLQRVLNAGIRAGDLVKQILTFSRQSDREIKPVQIKSITKEALKLIRASLPATIEIEQDIQSESPVLADPTQIHQIIMNLCTNAAQAMQGTSGKMRVNLTDVTLGKEIIEAHTDIDPGNFIKLSVSDSGSGISPEIQDRIFDPFFTTKQPGQGTGLGLSMVHGIVKDCKGFITVESTPKQGTNFHVFLPTIETETDERVVTRAPLPKGTERVLFVDDEPNQVDIGTQILELLGYTVTAITSSHEALEIFRNSPEAYDLVVTDMTMPKMTGDRLAKEILAIRPDIPIIISTGYSERITPDTANALGIKEMIMKPAVVGEIATTVRRVLDQVRDES